MKIALILGVVFCGTVAASAGPIDDAIGEFNQLIQGTYTKTLKDREGDLITVSYTIGFDGRITELSTGGESVLSPPRVKAKGPNYIDKGITSSPGTVRVERAIEFTFAEPRNDKPYNEGGALIPARPL
jgi:hypothetical protein